MECVVKERLGNRLYNGIPDIYYYADSYADNVELLNEGIIKGLGTLDSYLNGQSSSQ